MIGQNSESAMKEIAIWIGEVCMNIKVNKTKDYTFYTFHILGIENTHISDIATDLIRSNEITEIYMNRPEDTKSFEMKIRFSHTVDNPESVIKRAIGSKYDGIRIVRKL